jgi:putative nucleotidyltransferase-like protein
MAIEKTGRPISQVETLGPRNSQPATVAGQTLNSEQSIRQSVLILLSTPSPQNCSCIEELTSGQWTRLLRWLDFHGLALYFLDRLKQRNEKSVLPASVLTSLERRLHENTVRTRSMFVESTEIQHGFQKLNLRYALLKGLSLSPNSVPNPELRSQFDLDFLVAEEDLPTARECLTRQGYRLYGANGRSWEFKKNERPGITFSDLYKDTGSWRVELHTARNPSPSISILARSEWRDFSGFMMPVLSPVDLFLGQGLHASKHICSEFCRAAYLLEFRRHVLFRRDDAVFWNALHHMASCDHQSALRLGVVLKLITKATGEFAPEALTGWTMNQLSASVTLWIEMYGDRAVFGSFPGTKLYLLLQKELESVGVRAKRTLPRSLIPMSLPPPIIRAFPNEDLAIRLGRYRMQLNFILSRLRFHFVEGLRCAWESHKWQSRLKQTAR